MPTADDDSTSELTAPDSASSSALSGAAPEPPVVARLVIEIRSDGTRTVARGALEDTTLGERVTVEAHGTTPLALAAKLSRSLLTTPLLARQLSKAAGGMPLRALRQGGNAATQEPRPGDQTRRGAAVRALRALLGRSKDDDPA